MKKLKKQGKNIKEKLHNQSGGLIQKKKIKKKRKEN